ncbi:MAG: choice-of-anchor J domain-containing protein, partial [Candidatus Cloacimonetes bacterium]|nr:choice-of-anchor J domain-containing protein [Candidatus Cloacimonadota bacterium]
GWAKLGTTGSASTQASSSNSSPNCLYMYNGAVVALPIVNLTATNARIRYRGRANSSVGGIVEFGYLTNPADPATFVLIGSANTMSTLTYLPYTVTVGAISGTNYYAFRVSTSPAYSVLIDDLVIEETPTAPIFSYTPTSLSFGTANANIPTTYQNVKVTNIGVSTLDLLAADISLIGADPTQFGFTTTTGFPAALTADQFVNIPVRFNPTTPGDKSATLRIAYNSTNYDVALTGTAIGEFALYESFEGASYPPAGWSGWSSGTSYAYHGTKSSYVYTGTTAVNLITPTLAVTPTTVLNFSTYVYSSTYQKIQLAYYDGTAWTNFGDEISLTPAAWQNHSITLTGLTGNYKFGIGAYYGTSGSGASVYVDMVSGPLKAALAPDPVTLNSPADLAPDQAILPTLTWTPNTTGIGGVATGYKIYMDRSDTPIIPSSLIYTDDASPYTLTTALEYSTTYYWMVVASNNTGDAVDSPVRSFTTIADPTVTSINQDFSGTFAPLNWTLYSGQLVDPSSTLTTTTSGWTWDDWGNVADPVNKSAKMNIFGTSKYWLVTPPITMGGAGFQLELDIALTDYANTNVPESIPADDRFIILIGDGTTWSTANVLREWNNSGSPYVYNDVPTTGAHVTIPLDSYTGVKYIAFYGESTVSGNGDNDFFVDNVRVYTPVANDLAATAITGTNTGFVDTPVTHSVSVLNNGTSSQSSYTVYLKSVDTRAILATQVVSGVPLAPGTTVSYPLEWAPTTTGQLNIFGEVVLTGDTNTGNNTTTNLAFTTYPEGTLVEGFESGSIPNNWTVRNVDNQEQWLASTSNPHTGTYCARVNWDVPNDDWLITPPLQVTSTTTDQISFWIGNFSTYFSEDWEVLISTTDTEIASFSMIDSGNLATNGYEQKTYNLDAYNDAIIYLAIRCVSDNQLGFYADDFMGPLIYVPATLPSPVVTAEVVGTSVKISWPAIPYAYQYKIYVSDDPYVEEFTYAASTASLNYTLTAPVPTKMFCKVIASSDPIRNSIALPLSTVDQYKKDMFESPSKRK